MHQDYRDKLTQALEQLERDSRRRSLVPAVPLDAMAVERQGRRLINFSSNDYLGLARDPRLAAAAARGSSLGVGATASRLVCGTFPVHERLEQALCALKGTAAALVMGSGFQTNAAVLAALLDPQAAGGAPLVYTDRLAHASMYEGLRVAGVRTQRFRHNDLGHLGELLEQCADPGRFRLILTESVFSMDGDRADLPGLAALARRHGAFLYVDEAHATGVLGPSGAGLCAEPAVKGQVDMVMGTFGKALGGYGAFVACDGLLRDWLVNRCRGFIFSTALPPPVAAAALKALELLPALDDRRAHLFRQADRVRAALRRLGIDTLASDTQIIPAIIGPDAETLAASRAMEHLGILAVGIRPPTVPPGTGRLRLTLSAAHSAADIDQLIHAFQALGEDGRMSRILLVHGWGFAPALWDPLRAALPGHTWLALDLGYFGPARAQLPPALDLVAGHSFGCLWAMTHPDLAGIPLVAVNGFPRFSAAGDFPHGTPARVLERMHKRLREAPVEVLQAFHGRLGTAVPEGVPDLDRLCADLLRMRDQDARALPERQPVLACAAADDPLVPEAMSRQAFPGALRLLAEGGHALPLTRPGAVARVIEEGLGL